MRLLSEAQVKEICLANGFKEKVQDVGPGEEAVYDLNPYVYQAAKAIQQAYCRHETWLGHSGTGRVFCADCGAPQP